MVDVRRYRERYEEIQKGRSPAWKARELASWGVGIYGEA